MADVNKIIAINIHTQLKNLAGIMPMMVMMTCKWLWLHVSELLGNIRQQFLKLPLISEAKI